MISPVRAHESSSSSSSSAVVGSLSVSLRPAASFCENFGVTQKPSQTWACFTRCLGKSGKAAKANSCVNVTLCFTHRTHARACARARARVCARVRTNGRINECLAAFGYIEHSARFSAIRAQITRNWTRHRAEAASAIG